MLNTIIGKLITDGKRNYRIYFCSSFVARLIVCTSEGNPEHKFILQSYDVTELRNLIDDGKFIVIDEEPAPIVDSSKFNEKAKKQYEKARDFIQEVHAVYGPEYVGLMGQGNKPVWNELIKKYNLPRDVAWKYIRRYLQSGLSMNAVIDKRKTTKPKLMRLGTYSVNPGPCSKYGCVLTEKDVKNIDEEIKLLLADEVGGIAYHHYHLLNRCYLNEDGTYKDEFPSYMQFYNRYIRTVSKDVRAKRTIDRDEARNNYRLQLGSGRMEASRPGQYIEVDECELDVLVVSSVDKRQIIGRPILYMAMDVYSRAIVGLSVLLYNNSFLGISSLLLNIFEGSERYCARYGVTKGFECIPSGFCPEIIKSDQGAEYTSENFEELCFTLNTMHNLLPARLGSYKGGIERSFGFIQSFMRPHLLGKGLIRSTYLSDHKKTACYTLEAITQICINEVIAHNSSLVKNLKLPRAMKLNTSPIPIELWKYGIEHYGAPIPVTDANRNEYFYKCLIHEEATVNKRGIQVKGLTYYENTPHINTIMYRASYDGKSEKITVGIDQRDCGHIYYNDNGRIIPIPLIPGQIGNDYYNTTWTEYLSEKNLVADRIKEDERIRILTMATMHRNTEEILAAQEVPDYKPKATGINEARAAEKALTAAAERTFERMGFETPQFEESDKKLDVLTEVEETSLTESAVTEKPTASELDDGKTTEDSASLKQEEVSAPSDEAPEEDLSNLSLSEIRKRNQGDAILKAMKESKHINY